MSCQENLERKAIKAGNPAMAEHSTIEWTDATWNPVTGCSVVSPGCTNCYAMRLAGTRLRNHPSRAGLTVESKARGVEAAGRQGSKKSKPVWNGQVRLNEQWLDEPLRWKRPRMIFVCAHGDLFHESVPDEWIDRVFAVMTLATQHTFQVLTKRSARMRDYLLAARSRNAAPTKAWPLPNVWLGVSAERQLEADERIPDLLATPAAVRFLSAEPLLGPINLRSIDISGDEEILPLGAGWLDRLEEGEAEGPRLDWVIAGGESGVDARPMHPAWARQLRDQCTAAGVPFFFKQWGEFTPDDPASTHTAMRQVGKKAAGRLLDGVEHNAMPEPRP